MMVNATGYIEKGSNAYEIFGYDTETEKVVAIKVNPVHGYARKNGKKLNLDIKKGFIIRYLQINEKEMIGQRSWNASYKGLPVKEVIEYINN